jgi:hypothetical protein
MPPAMGSISPAVKGWSIATGATRSSGWKNTLHIRPQQTRRRSQRPKRTSTLGDRDIERVHVGPRTGFPHDSGGTADVIRVAVSKNQVLELVWRTAKPPDRPKDGCFFIWVAGVDQR